MLRTHLLPATGLTHDRYPSLQPSAVHLLATNDRLHSLLSVLPPKKLSGHPESALNVLEPKAIPEIGASVTCLTLDAASPQAQPGRNGAANRESRSRSVSGRCASCARFEPSKIGLRTLDLLVKRVATQANLEGSFSTHSIRAGTATSLYSLGVEESEISRHLRHKSVTVTRIYDRPSNQLERDPFRSRR